MGFPKGASIRFGQGRGQNPAREVASFIEGQIAGLLETGVRPLKT